MLCKGAAPGIEDYLDIIVGSSYQDTLPEWSKGVDSSSTSASCVGLNPTGVMWRSFDHEAAVRSMGGQARRMSSGHPMWRMPAVAAHMRECVDSVCWRHIRRAASPAIY